ncbi:hypothetical protein BD770DRAFT_431088, partial [Pilaira anomala]
HLVHYCRKEDVDIIVVFFFHTSSNSIIARVKIKRLCYIKGGATPSYGVDSIKAGEELADELCNTSVGERGF